MEKTPITKIILHCSDSPDDLDLDVSDIRRWHTDKPPKGRGWSDVGYHFVIKRDGTIQAGRQENGDGFLTLPEMGAHVKGHNRDSLGVCWIGRKHMSHVQRRALIYWIGVLLNTLKLKVADVYGHYEFDRTKTCPNISMDEFRQTLRKEGHE